MNVHPDTLKQIKAVAAMALPTASLAASIYFTEDLNGSISEQLLMGLDMLKVIHTKPFLLGGFVAGLMSSVGIIRTLDHFFKSDFTGAHYKKFIRGTEIVSASKLKQITKEKEPQVTIAGVPVPTKLEAIHTLIMGSTGAGKSCILREMAYSIIQREKTSRDRMIFIDPNGDMISKFYTKGDVILNPFDGRSKGWSIFNEIRNQYDYDRYSYSLVPLGETKEAEEWNSYGRLLLREIAKKLNEIKGSRKPTVADIHRIATIISHDDLRAFLTGTLAESLFAGSNEASRALTSARFVLSGKFDSLVEMPDGPFSIRDWLDEGTGNMFITWREDMAKKLKPLISAWTDVICTSMLSLEESRDRKIWLFIDELASLDKLASFGDALTKGRKHGLRIVAGLQAPSQLDEQYGRDAAQTLRANFSSLVVLRGVNTDPVSTEIMSKSLGEHEVERERDSTSSKGFGSKSTSTQLERVRERIVMPSEIANQSRLKGWLALAEGYPICKIEINPLTFVQNTPAFVETGIL